MVGKRRMRPVLFSSPLLNGGFGGVSAASSLALVRSSMVVPCPAQEHVGAYPYRRTGVHFAGICAVLSEMTVGRSREFEHPALRVDEARVPARARAAADLADGHADATRGLAQRVELVGRNARQDFEIVAAGQDRLDQRRLG